MAVLPEEDFFYVDSLASSDADDYDLSYTEEAATRIPAVVPANPGECVTTAVAGPSVQAASSDTAGPPTITLTDGQSSTIEACVVLPVAVAQPDNQDTEPVAPEIDYDAGRTQQADESMPGPTHNDTETVLQEEWSQSECHMHDIRFAERDVASVPPRKRPEQLKLLVLGQSETGKTTTIRNLMASFTGESGWMPTNVSELTKQDFIDAPEKFQTIIDNRSDALGRLALTYIVQEAPALDGNAETAAQLATDYIKNQATKYAEQEQGARVNRDALEDTRVDAVLYFLPTNARVSAFDCAVMQIVSEVAIVIPIMCKADCLNEKELSERKQEMAKLVESGLGVWQFPADIISTMLKAAPGAKSNTEEPTGAPFMVMAGNDADDSVHPFWFVRRYRWGMCEAYREVDSDLQYLRRLLLEDGFWCLKDAADDLYRSNLCSVQDSRPPPAAEVITADAATTVEPVTNDAATSAKEVDTTDVATSPKKIDSSDAGTSSEPTKQVTTSDKTTSAEKIDTVDAGTLSKQVLTTDASNGAKQIDTADAATHFTKINTVDNATSPELIKQVDVATSPKKTTAVDAATSSETVASEIASEIASAAAETMRQFWSSRSMVSDPLAEVKAAFKSPRVSDAAAFADASEDPLAPRSYSHSRKQSDDTSQQSWEESVQAGVEAGDASQSAPSTKMNRETAKPVLPQVAFDESKYEEVIVSRVQRTGDTYRLTLSIPARGRILCMRVGQTEGGCLVNVVENRDVARPCTYDSWKTSLDLMGARVLRTVVTMCERMVFFSSLHTIRADGGVVEQDARPSDAINLALRFEAPVYVSRDVIDRYSKMSAK